MANKEVKQSLDIPVGSSPKVEVVMVPFPSQSHLNQLLRLSQVISSYNIKVHYVSSALLISQVKSRTTNQTPNPNIHFHSFPTPDFSSPQPNYSKFPSHNMPSYEATFKFREPVKAVIESLSETTRRVIVIHDTLMSYVVQDAGSFPNAEAYHFNCVSAIFQSVFLRDQLGLNIREDIPSSKGVLYPEFRLFIDRLSTSMTTNKKAGILLNTCRVLESEFIDFLVEKEREVDSSLKLWAVGPLESVGMLKKEATFQHKCLEWLDMQEPNSVLYVSFGTTTFMDDDQIRELAKGLELSGTKFIWVLRDADKGNIFDGTEVRRPQLPQGFEEMGMGLVVRDWAPQLGILGHSSTGGFMSHCGWNSCLESLSLGVPIAAWPMHSDQPMNAYLVTQLLKAGLVVKEWSIEEVLVSSSEISEVVKRLMNSEQGKMVRERAEELGCELRKCTEEGGVSRLELDSFVAHITRA